MEQAYRSFEGGIKLMERNSDFLYDIEIWLLNGLVNRNQWKYENLEANKNLFCGTPILCAYVGDRVGDGHTFRMKKDRDTGEEYASFMDANAERIVGALSEKPEDIRLEEVDGVQWIVGKGFLWAWYARELVDKIENDKANGRDLSISIETLVTKFEMDGDVERELEWTVLGTTILGDGVMPAVEDARIVALQEITGEFEELKLRAASYIDGSAEGIEEGKEPEEGTGTKPQDNKTKRRVGMKALSKRQLAELSNRFEGYSVLAGGTDDSGMTHICLMSANGTPAMYSTDNINDSVIVPEKIVHVNAQISYEVGEESIAFDSTLAVDDFAAQITTLTNKLNQANEDVSALNTELDTMKANEQARRISAAKAKAVDTLNRFNANRDDKVSEDILVKINEDIDNKEYSDCLNGEGQWIGEAKVEEAVLAACAMKVMEIDKVSREKNNSQYVWSGMNGGHEDVDSIDGLLASFGIQ